MSKGKKRSGRHRSRTRKDKHRKRHKKKSKDKSKKSKQTTRKDQYFEERPGSLAESNRHMAQRHKQDIIFVIFLVILALSMFGGYYIYEMYWDAGEDDANGDTSGLDNENGASDNGGDNDDSNRIEWYMYDEGLQLSKSENKPAMLDFYFDGCYWCDELDKNTYSDSRVIEKAKSFVSIKVDTHETDAYNGQDLAGQYNIQGCPTIVFLDAQGIEVNRVGGYEDANQFLADMDEALKKS